jgi:UDP-glucose 4-epimerase
VVLDDLSTGSPDNVNRAATLQVADIRGLEVGRLLARHRPDAVVHLAAQAAVPRSVSDPALDASINVMGMINLLDACRRHDVRGLVYLSTGGAAYGDTPVLPTPEDHPRRPASPYGVSKVAAEMYAACWHALTGMQTVTLRLANVYGPRQQPEGEAGVVAIFASRLLAGQPCTIYGDGEQTRDYVYVGDVAEAVVRALAETGADGVFNIGTSRQTSVNSLHALLCQAAGVRAAPVYAAARPGDLLHSALDAGRARRVLGWSPRTTLEAGLATTVAWFRGRPR